MWKMFINSGSSTVVLKIQTAQSMEKFKPEIYISSGKWGENKIDQTKYYGPLLPPQKYSPL